MRWGASGEAGDLRGPERPTKGDTPRRSCRPRRDWFGSLPRFSGDPSPGCCLSPFGLGGRGETGLSLGGASPVLQLIVLALPSAEPVRDDAARIQGVRYSLPLGLPLTGASSRLESLPCRARRGSRWADTCAARSIGRTGGCTSVARQTTWGASRTSRPTEPPPHRTRPVEAAWEQHDGSRL
jgi:hypothetical protein